MPDWTRSMQQSYRFYRVDPVSWLDTDMIGTIKSCSIVRDSELSTLGSGSFVLGEKLDEGYIRVYLETVQDGITEQWPLATLLMISPRSKFNGQSWSIDADGYTPLIELKEKLPEIGFTIMEGQNVLDLVTLKTRECARAPLVPIKDATALVYEDYSANTDDSMLTFLSDLLNLVKYRFDLDETGHILYAPIQDIESIQPRASFDDGNSSILCKDISEDDDIFGIPNVVEVIYSNNSISLSSKIVNDDPNSPTSTIRRGREIQYRETSPSIAGVPTQEQLDEYAEKLLKNLSTVQRTISFEHGYKPIRPGDAVLLNYSRAKIQNVKAVIIRQTIQCDKVCKIQETAVYTAKLWK